MKIAILSDIHEGINRKKTQTSIMDILKKWISENNPDVFIISGDMTAGPTKSLDRLNELQECAKTTKILYVHGNHDVYFPDSKQAYEILQQFPGNLSNGPVKLGSEWVVIGDGGWYDYSFGIPGFKDQEFAAGTYQDFTWPDKINANWPNTDQEITAQSLVRLESWLKEFANKKIILVTHFVPFKKFIQYKNELSWDFFNAMLGSTHFGDLALKYHVRKYIFGHVHTRYHETYNGMEMICNPLGYFPHEWHYSDAEKEIQSTIKIIKI